MTSDQQSYSHSQLSPEDHAEQLHTQTHGQAQVQSQQDGSDVGAQPDHLCGQ